MDNRAMKSGLAIVNAYLILPGAQHFYERMRAELAHRDVALGLTTNAEILSYVDSEGNLAGKTPNVDFILYLDKDPYVSHMLEMKGMRLFNSARAIELCDDKMLTHISLANHGIKMPKTISGPLNYSTEDGGAFLTNLERELRYPFVAKGNFGSLGKEVFLIHNHQELISEEKELWHTPRIYQEFIAASAGYDYRLIVIGGRFVAGMKRQSGTGDFRSNIGLGGRATKATIPASFIALAEKAASILRLDYCGVDLLKGADGEPILDEVNSNAFIEGVEKATGVDVAGAYADHIVKTIY